MLADFDPAFGAVLLGAFVVAVLYSSVGHGGASGYLAVLVLAGFARPSITPLVLLLNVAVAGLAFTAYYRAGHFSLRLLAPFIVTSLPGAIVGASLTVSPRVYAIVLGGTLVAAGCRFVLLSRAEAPKAPLAPRTLWTVGPVVGGLLGVLAGMVGVGGGIFLSPLLLLMGWADAKRTGAVSAAFIVVNSLGGLATQLVRGASVDLSLGVPLLVTVAAGGMLGAFAGANRLSNVGLQRLLGVVLLGAGVKLLATH